MLLPFDSSTFRSIVLLWPWSRPKRVFGRIYFVGFVFGMLHLVAIRLYEDCTSNYGKTVCIFIYLLKQRFVSCNFYGRVESPRLYWVLKWKLTAQMYNVELWMSYFWQLLNVILISSIQHRFLSFYSSAIVFPIFYPIQNIMSIFYLLIYQLSS